MYFFAWARELLSCIQTRCCISGSYLTHGTSRSETSSSDCTWKQRLRGIVFFFTLQSNSNPGYACLTCTCIFFCVVVTKVGFIILTILHWQAFHVLYHTENNVLLGAPTGSGKTISAELAMLHLFNTQPDMKVNCVSVLWCHVLSLYS